MVYRRQQSIYQIPYFRALAIWNQTQSPLKDKAWVIPLGPKKIPPDGSIYHKQVNEIRKGDQSSSSSSSSSSESPPPPSPPSSSSSTKASPKTPQRTPSEESEPRYEYNPEVQEFPDIPEEKEPAANQLGSIGSLYPPMQPAWSMGKFMQIKQSTIPSAGEGVFTTVILRAKQLIGIYTGTVVSEAAAEESDRSIEIRAPRKFYVDGNINGNWTSKINHASGNKANVKWRQNGYIYMLRTVKPGEELFVNYGPHAQEIIQRGKRKKAPESLSPKHMLYHRPEHLKYVRQASDKSGKKYSYSYDISLNQERSLKAPTFKHSLHTVELGAGAYGNVYVGWEGEKRVAVKFQILDAPIPKSDCALRNETKECRTMSKGEFLKETQYMGYAYQALGNMVPEVLGVNYWNVDNVTVEPSLPPAERLKLPTQIASTTLTFFLGQDLYEVQDGYDESEQENITDSIMLAMKLLYEYVYDKNNPDKHLKWADLHFGNILIEPSGTIKFIDMGMLVETREDWSEVEKFYKERLEEEWGL